MVLKTCATEDQIKIESALNSDRITITRGDDLRQWELKLLEIKEDTMDIPQQTYNVSADIPSSDFLKLCRDLKEMKPSPFAWRTAAPYPAVLKGITDEAQQS